MYIQNTLTPYDEIDYKGIQYTTCRDFNHISRYRGLRQVIHSPLDIQDRFIALETPNGFETSNTEIIWHEVLGTEVNRLDLIAQKYLGSASYAWVICYFNQIEDGFTCWLGQQLKIPKSITNLMRTGEILQSVTALTLNLSSE
jgi:hypothetical protein